MDAFRRDTTGLTRTSSEVAAQSYFVQFSTSYGQNVVHISISRVLVSETVGGIECYPTIIRFDTRRIAVRTVEN
jgi:hypothetical protein